MRSKRKLIVSRKKKEKAIIPRCIRRGRPFKLDASTKIFLINEEDEDVPSNEVMLAEVATMTLSIAQYFMK